MKCIICNSNMNTPIYEYKDPDKYEMSMGVKGRTWFKCECGHYQQFHMYPLDSLTDIYDHIYRSTEFRGKTLKESFDDIMSITDSENNQRVLFFCNIFPVKCKVWDIGSGIGVFPYNLQKEGYKVVCHELGQNSIQHLKNLGLRVKDNYKADITTLIHVLEHIEDPVGFLSQLAGTVYIEVPDAEEFEYRDILDDEFNSCHLHFFNEQGLRNVMNLAGFKVGGVKKIRYVDRDLARLTMWGREEEHNVTDKR